MFYYKYLTYIYTFNFRLLHLKYPELDEAAYGSSLSRESRYKRMTTNKTAASIQDMLEVLGNREDDPWPMFSDKPDARVSTINLGERVVLYVFYYRWSVC